MSSTCIWPSQKHWKCTAGGTSMPLTKPSLQCNLKAGQNVCTQCTFSMQQGRRKPTYTSTAYQIDQQTVLISAHPRLKRSSAGKKLVCCPSAGGSDDSLQTAGQLQPQQPQVPSTSSENTQARDDASADIQTQTEKQRLRFKQTLQSFSESKPEVSASDTSTSTNEAIPRIELPWYRKPFLTWAFVTWSWLLLILQWAPLMPGLVSPATSWEEWILRACGVALLVPDTPAATAWQLDMLSWISGGPWYAPLSASFLFSGVLPTLVFTRSLEDAGSVLEAAYGPLVMGIHIAMSAVGAALCQLFLSPATQTITGPAMVCGVHAGLAGRLFLDRWQLSRKSGAAIVSESDDWDASLLTAPLIRRSSIVTWCLAVALGLFQPMLGIWGIVGGVVGGLLACVVSIPLITVIRKILFYVISTGLTAIEFAIRLPMLLLRFVTGLVMLLVGVAGEAVQTFRRL